MIERKIVELRDQIEQILLREENGANTVNDNSCMDVDMPDVALLLAEIEAELGRLGSLSSTLNLDELQNQNQILNEVLSYFLVGISHQQQIEETARMLDAKIQGSYELRRIIETVKSV